MQYPPTIKETLKDWVIAIDEDGDLICTKWDTYYTMEEVLEEIGNDVEAKKNLIKCLINIQTQCFQWVGELVTHEN